MKIRLAVTAATCLVAGASPALAAPSPPSTHIYLSVPKGTAGAKLMEKGVRAAIAARRGRAGTVRVKLIVLNDAVNGRWNAQRTARNAARAAADPRAIAYIGEGNSGATAIAMPILNRAGMVHTSPVSTSVSLTDPANHATLQPTGTQTFFRPIPNDSQQAESLVQYVRTSGVSRIAVVDDADTYGTGLADLVEAAAARHGIAVVTRQSAPAGQVDVNALKASGANGVVVAMTPSTGGVRVIKAAHAAMPSTLIFSGEAMAQREVAKSLGKAQRVMRLTAPATPTDPRAPVARRLGADASRPFVVFSYNATMAVLDATRRASAHGPVTRASVRSAVFDGSLVAGLSAPWRVQPDGNGQVGVFSELRMSGGSVLTPGDIAGRRLRVCGTRVCMTTPKRRAKLIVRFTSTVNVSSADVEDMLIQLTKETRIKAKQQQSDLLAVTDLLAVIRQREEQMAGLSARRDALQAVRSTQQPTADSNAPVLLTSQPHYVLLNEIAPGKAWTIRDLVLAIAEIDQELDALRRKQNMDVLLLQVTLSQRNFVHHVIEWSKEIA